jgi:NAD(P)H-flavin reductase
MSPRRFIVRRNRRETYDTFTLDLEPVDGDGLCFKPGQFNQLWAYGMGESPISISGDPTRPEVLIHTIRAVGPVTEAMKRYKPGDMVGVRGPFGAPWPVEAGEGGDLLFIAGGIGLAPLRPAVYQAIHTRERFRRVSLLMGARTPADLIYRSELERWRSRFDMRVAVSVDVAKESDKWFGNVGFVTALIPRVQFDVDDVVALICGPEIMIRNAARDLIGRGVPEDKIYISMERNMHCGVGLCGHCQWGSEFVCADGPVFRYDKVGHLMAVREV